MTVNGILDRLIRADGPMDYVVFCATIIISAGALNYSRELLFSGGNQIGFLQSLARTMFTAIPLTAFGALVLAHLAKLKREYEHLSITDVLTGLPNRRKVLGDIETAISEATPGVLLVADVDNFKRLNDTYGHPAGDACLQQLADFLTLEVRSGDALGRIGGEEFALFLPNAEEARADRLATALANGVAVEIPGTGTVLQITLSVGVVSVSHPVTFEELFKRADHALYVAKNQGRACAIRWSSDLDHLAAFAQVETWYEETKMAVRG